MRVANVLASFVFGGILLVGCDFDPVGPRPGEPMTLVEFDLEEVDGGTKLTVTESGFDNIPLARRAEAFRMNSEGWGIQVENIRKYVEGQS